MESSPVDHQEGPLRIVWCEADRCEVSYCGFTFLFFWWLAAFSIFHVPVDVELHEILVFLPITTYIIWTLNLYHVHNLQISCPIQ